MAQVALVAGQTQTVVVSDGSPSLAYTNNITAGNALIALFGIQSSTTRIMSIQDDLNGSPNVWADQLGNYGASSRLARTGVYLNSAGGACTITMTEESPGGPFSFSGYLTIAEVENADSIENALNGENRESNGATSAFFDPAINVSAESLFVGIMVHNANAGNHTPPSITGATWTEHLENSGSIYAYHLTGELANAVTGDTFTVSHTNRWYVSVAFTLAPASGGGGGFEPAWAPRSRSKILGLH